jgi:restriction system protein
MRIYLRDGEEHTLREAIERIARDMKLNAEDARELLPSGRQAKFDNRVGWARTYLKKAVLLESTGRGKFRITARGRTVLNEHPHPLNTQFLMRFPEFQEFRTVGGSEDGEENVTETQKAETQTPRERLEQAYQTIRRSLADDLLEQIRTCSWKFFEKLVIDLLLAMKYGGSRPDVAKAFRQSRDGGVDGVIKQDALGLDVVYTQAKKWDSNVVVGRPVVQAFAGSLDGFRAKKGVFITTSSFSRDAQEYADRIEKRVILIDGKRLAELMIDYGVGVSEKDTYSVKEVDFDYFTEE